MEGDGWVGSCCEPNCVFVVCKQFPASFFLLFLPQGGGCTTPRNDWKFDDELEWTRLEPFSGNAAIGYARLERGGQPADRSCGSGRRRRRPVTTWPFRRRSHAWRHGVDFPRGDWDPAGPPAGWGGAHRPDVGRRRRGTSAPARGTSLVGGDLAVSRVLSAGEDIAFEVQVGGWTLSS
ncbi:hypothetical protein LX36DRAFT_664885 [Colletotrichum falcatum]|nr:hypothetical protein LX36DRAFT_664885 [Colletotrichum falcatum]